MKYLNTRWFYTILIVIIGTQSYGQLVDHEGDVKIRGKLDLKDNFNLIIGESTGRFASGSSNILMGYEAGENLDTSYQNTIIGYEAGSDITDVLGNTILGYESCYDCKGNYNTFLGNSSGYHLSGNENVTIGYHAGRSGPNSMSSSKGNYNVLVGSYSDKDEAGDYNTMLGYRAEAAPVGQDSIVYGIAIGAESEVRCSNCAVIGGEFPSNSVNLGIGTNSPETKLHVTSENSTTFRLANRSTGSVSIDLIRNEKNSTNTDWRISNNNSGILKIGHNIDLVHNTPTNVLSLHGNGTVTIQKAMKLTPLKEDPYICTAAIVGTLYFNETISQLMICRKTIFFDPPAFEWRPINAD